MELGTGWMEGGPGITHGFLLMDGWLEEIPQGQGQRPTLDVETFKASKQWDVFLPYQVVQGFFFPSTVRQRGPTFSPAARMRFSPTGL